MLKPYRQIALLWLQFSSAGCAMAIEEPKYEVLEKSGDFELRQYAPMIVAETVVSGSMDEASGKGFRLIADYIFGNNSIKGGDSQKISLTAPVTMEAADTASNGSKEISMTAPVTMEQVDGAWRVHFVMPSEYTMASLPAPNNDKVQLREIPGKQYAVIRFSGLAGEDKVTAKTSELLDWLARQNLEAVGKPELARYNPPWTLPFLRRNEVMIESPAT
jgi:effector-binding domain-containing protein